MTRVKYIGPKPLPLVLQTPIPHLSRSERTGEAVFDPEADLDDASASFLLTECAGAFERVGLASAPTDQAPRPHKPKEDPLIYVGKRFSGKGGKWKACAFIKRHKAEAILGIRRLKIMSRTIHWELVPIALSDVTADQLDNTWNPKGNKLNKSADPDSITVATAGVLEPSIP